MRFKVGDRVRILNDLEVDKMYGSDCVIPKMVEWLGKIATISIVSGDYYNLDIDGGEWCWTDEMLEEVGEMETKKYIKFDIPEWVNWLARESNGDLYGYRNKPNKGVATWCIGPVNVEQINCYLVSDDPNHYPQVKWEDEEPKAYKDGIILINPDELDEIHFYPSEEVSSGKSELDTNEAIIALRNFGNTLTDNEKLRWGLTTVNEIRGGTENPPESDMIQNPPHYKQYSFEPIDIITEVVKEYPPEIGFHIGTTLKYLFRSPFKDNLPQDLAKAEYYLQRANKELTDE